MSGLVWRWRTCADPNRPRGAGRIAHPLAARAGQACREVCRGRNGNRLLAFDDGFLVVAPYYAAAASGTGS